MKKTVLVMMALAAAVARRAAAGPLTPEQTLERRGIGELELSPDGTRVVFTVTEPVKGTARQRNIWLLDVASGSVAPADLLRQERLVAALGARRPRRSPSSPIATAPRSSTCCR